VLSLDGKPMDNSRELQVNVYRYLVGDVVTLEILRDGRVDRVPVAVTERRDLSGLLTPSTHASTWWRASASSG
jgi:S1-C subfamily serine protease